MCRALQKFVHGEICFLVVHAELFCALHHAADYKVNEVSICRQVIVDFFQLVLVVNRDNVAALFQNDLRHAPGIG